jgi:single-strand selective monofunctional uracil DNA glycosylase
VAIGAFAEKRAREALGDGARLGRILHPSPASPAANDWATIVDAQLRALGFEPS